MDDSVVSAIELLKQAIGVGGSWYASVIAIVVVGIRILRTATIQGLLPSTARWESSPRWARVLAVFASSALASLAMALIGGQSVASALIAAVGVGIGAIGSHKATQAVGHAQTRARLKLEGAAYHPTSLRTVISPILPIDHAAVSKTRDIARAASRREPGHEML